MSDEPKQEIQTLDLEVAPIESITRAEVDVQIATARQYPRSIAQFYKRAEAMVCVDQETAESCFYQLRRRDKRTGEVKVIEGESIRMAEIVAANFGNLRSAVHIVGHTPTRVSVRAVCHDLETNNLIAVEKQAKTAYSDGSPYNEDMAITTANALVSKALRDAIFRVVPKALVKPLKEKAKLVAFGQGAAFAERRKKAIAWATETRKVPLDRVLATLGVKGVDDMTVEHLETLTGLKNAIMEGDTTADEAFPPLDEGKAVFDHPAKTATTAEESKAKTEAQKTEKKPKSEPKAEPKQEQKTAPKAETKPEPEPAKETVQTKPEEPAKTEPTPEPAPAAEPEKPTEPAPAPEPEPEKKPSEPTELTAAQKDLKAKVEGLGHTFEDLIGWGKTAVPFIKSANPPLISWTSVPDDKAKFMSAQIKGIDAGIKEWKKKQGRS